MPELPEVEVIRRGLAGVLPGREITRISVLEQRSFPGFDEAIEHILVGAEVGTISRRGKLLMIDLDSGGLAHVLLVHLRMTGQLVYRAPGMTDPSLAGGYPNASLVGELPDKSTRVIIEFSDGAQLFFNDQRKFGYLKLVAAEIGRAHV
jgi:formamidopyrimidine-DNA glycosylase